MSSVKITKMTGGTLSYDVVRFGVIIDSGIINHILQIDYYLGKYPPNIAITGDFNSYNEIKDFFKTSYILPG